MPLTIFLPRLSLWYSIWRLTSHPIFIRRRNHVLAVITVWCLPACIVLRHIHRVFHVSLFREGPSRSWIVVGSLSVFHGGANCTLVSVQINNTLVVLFYIILGSVTLLLVLWRNVSSWWLVTVERFFVYLNLCCSLRTSHLLLLLIPELKLCIWVLGSWWKLVLRLLRVVALIIGPAAIFIELLRWPVPVLVWYLTLIVGMNSELAVEHPHIIGL